MSKETRRLIGRLFYFLASIAIVVAPLRAQGPAMTVISDVVYRANGQPANGAIVVSWPAFTTADRKPVAAGELSIAIGTQGNVTFSLVPNQGGDPGGTYYKAVYKLTDGTTFTEYWVVPAATPTTIAAIRATVVPRQVGAQYVNRQYVDTAVAATDQQAVHRAGSEVITGVKSFAASPEVPVPATGAAAVNRDYVTGAITAISGGFVDKNGDSMNGPLLLPGDPVAPQQAANRHYVDLVFSDASAALVQKLNRLIDTPINLAGNRYSSQFSSSGAPLKAQVDDACLDLAGANGTVIIPSTSASTELTSTLPDNCHVYDQRRKTAPNEYGTDSTAFQKGLVHRFRWTAPNSDVLNGSASTNQTFGAISIFAHSAKGGINNGTLGATTKSTYNAGSFILNSATPGQHQALTGMCQKYAAGDCIGLAGITQMWGGSKAGFGDEGALAGTFRSIQGGAIFTGTVSAKSGNTLTFTSTANHQTIGAGQRWLINTSSGVYSTGTAQYDFTPTVTGVGTAWNTLPLPASSYCFSLDANATDHGGRKFVIPVASVTDATHLVLITGPGRFPNTTAGTYKLFPCSEVAEVTTNDITSTSPSVAPQLTLVSAANFNVGDTAEEPLSLFYQSGAISVVITPAIPTVNTMSGLGFNCQNPTVNTICHDMITSGGTFGRYFELNAWQWRPSHLFLMQDTLNAGLPACYFCQNTGALNQISDIFNIQNADKASANRVYYDSADDAWTFFSSAAGTGRALQIGWSTSNIGIGSNRETGTQLKVTTTGTNNALNVNGNTTGYLLNTQVGAVNRFQVSSAQAYFNNGLDVKGYADNLTTQKWQITGMSGKASFNGGVCQDSAQTICDLSGAGAPSGVCTTGSTYRRTDGATSTTLYICEAAAWIAGGGAGASTWSAIGNPTAAQSLSMGANTTTWTWNAATGASDLARLTDTASNTGTGHILSVETATASNAKPFQVKARGTAALEVNEFGTVSTLSGVTTSAGLTIQVGGAFALKGRDDWNSPLTINAADFTSGTSTASSTTVRGGDVTSATGATTGGGLLLRSGGASSASGTPGSLQIAQTYVRDTTVTSGLLQCFKAAAAMIVGDCGLSTLNSVGVAISASNTNPVVVQFQGIATLQFDAAASPSAGWFACSSATAGGKVTVQSAACAAGRQVGIVAQNGTSITSGKVFLQTR